MNYFSYNDYADCIENRKFYRITKVEEKIERYETNNGIIQEHSKKNKIIKILSNEWELKKFLKEFLNFSFNENVVYYDSETNITDKKINNNLTCKIENRENFIFIKVLDKIDNNISYRIFERSTDIIKKWSNEEKKENSRYPIVIPIVIYTGKKEWKSSNKNIRYIKYEKNRINFSYNIIDINNITSDKLKNMNSEVAKTLLQIKNKY